MIPGAPLVLTVDTGGERWTLEGRPLHGGDRIDVLAEGIRSTCGTCDGEGRVGEGERRGRCPDCDGRGYLFAPLWWPARFEYRNDADGTGPAFLYLPVVGGGGAQRHAIEVRNGDELRCRWPGVVTS